MNAFFSFDLSMVYECEQELRTINNTPRYEIGHPLNIGCSFVTLREPCNNQQPRCDITWLHFTNHLYHGFPSKRFKNLTLR